MKDWFEDKLNERFDDFESPTDVEAAWAAVQSRRQPKRKRLGAWWFLLLFGVFLGSVALGTGWYFYGNKESVKTETKSEKSKDLPATAKVDFKANEKENLQRFEELIQNEATAQNQQVRDFSEEKRTENISRESKNTPGILPKPNKNFTVAETTQTQSGSPVILLAVPSKSEIIMPSTPTAFLFPPVLQPLAIPPSDLTVNPKTDKLKVLKNRAGITVAYGKSFAREYKTALTPRSTATPNIDAWSLNLFYQRKIKNGWYLQADAGYRQATDLFEDNYTELSEITDGNQVLQIDRYPDGSEAIVTGEATAMQKETVRARLYQRHRRAFVGLRAGKELLRRSGFFMNVAGGADVAVLRSASGKILQNQQINSRPYAELSSVDYSDTPPLLTGVLSAGIGRSFAANSELVFSLDFRANLNKNLRYGSLRERRYYLLPSLTWQKAF